MTQAQQNQSQPQGSSQHDLGGLTLIGTPIGNLGDLSPRARQALADADVVCAEDTRVSARLLNACNIHARLERCDENVIARRAAGLTERMQMGEHIAFVSDAGMPAVADPGAKLVDACRDADIPVDVIPGPSAVTCAIAAAGFTGEAFYFGGFLPRKDGPRAKVLQQVAGLPAILVFYESPHRTSDSLAVIAQVMPRRRVAVARELTKVHQEVTRAMAAEMAQTFAQREDLKGEIVIVIDAPSQSEIDVRSDEGFNLEQAIKEGLEQGEPKSALARALAARSGRPRGEIYDLIQTMAHDGQ